MHQTCVKIAVPCTPTRGFLFFLVATWAVRIGFWFLVCYATTQLATQLQQRCIQVVSSNKKARKRLTESNGTPTMDLGHMNVFFKVLFLCFDL